MLEHKMYRFRREREKKEKKRKKRMRFKASQSPTLGLATVCVFQRRLVSNHRSSPTRELSRHLQSTLNGVVPSAASNELFDVTRVDDKFGEEHRLWELSPREQENTDADTGSDVESVDERWSRWIDDEIVRDVMPSGFSFPTNDPDEEDDDRGGETASTGGWGRDDSKRREVDESTLECENKPPTMSTIAIHPTTHQQREIESEREQNGSHITQGFETNKEEKERERERKRDFRLEHTLAQTQTQKYKWRKLSFSHHFFHSHFLPFLFFFFLFLYFTLELESA